jgi:hypothetical protein
MKCECKTGEKKCNGLRTMSDREKAVLKEHYEGKAHGKSEKMKMILAICKSKTVIDTKSKIIKLHKKIF